MNAHGGIHCTERAPRDGAKGAFLLLHGMESHSGWFADCADRLVRAGWAVLAFDRPGWGMSPPGQRGHMESYRDLVETVAGLAVRARRKYGSVHLAGMSWGGMAALYCALRRGWLFDSVALLAPGVAARRDLPLSEKARVLRSVLRGKKTTAVHTAFRPEDFTRDPLWQDFLRNDPYRTKSVTAGFCVETLKMRRFLRETAGRRRLPPALCLLAGDDSVIDNAAAARLCTRAGALVEILPGAAHTLIFERPEQTAALLAHHAEKARRAPERPVWVVGAGAVGGAVASLLSFAGADVGVLAKASHLPALRGSGLTLRCGKAVRSAGGLVFADSPEALPPGPALVILAVKSFDTEAVLAALQGRIPLSASILSLQNGVGNEERIANAFPQHTVIAGAICAELERAGGGVVRWADDRGGFAGALYRGDAYQAQSAWEAFLPKTGMECRWMSGAMAAAQVKYSKLMLNIGFNALNAATGLSAAALLADRNYGALAVEALREGFAVLRALGVPPVNLPGFPVALLGRVVRLPVPVARRLLLWQTRRAPADAPLSMRQDMLNHRQHTEIQDLNGKIIALGTQHSLPTPANEHLVDIMSTPVAD